MSQLINFNDSVNISSSVITFGNFDGVHKGHRSLIDSLNNYKRKLKSKSILITFNPHTKAVINNGQLNNHLITSHNDKLCYLQELGVDYIITIDFNIEISKISASDFIDIIKTKYKPKLFLIGYDNNFGYKGKGDYHFLLKYLSNSNIKVEKFDSYLCDDKLIKSSYIKSLILSGSIDEANFYLGRYFSLNGIVIKGDMIGRTIGYPTANIALNEKQQIIPKSGVYCVNLIFDNRAYQGLCNIGFRPTVINNGKLSIEVHLLNCDNINLYNKNIIIEFKTFIRNEKKFKSTKELIKQINKDVQSANKD